MDNELRDKERNIEFLRVENEELDEELTKAQKKRAIAEAKEFYGKDYKKMIGGAVKWLGKRKVDSETLQSLHSMGAGGQELREMTKPPRMRSQDLD